MKNIVTKNARSLVQLITKEYELQRQRAEGGYIETDRIEEYLIERLNAIGKRNKSVRAFLTYVGPIDPKDDDDPDKPWAKDPREGRRHVVLSKRDTSEGVLGASKDFESDRPWPEPGERIA